MTNGNYGLLSKSELQKIQLIQHIYTKGHTSIHNTMLMKTQKTDILVCR